MRSGEKADLEVIAAAALAWVDALRAAASVLDPDSELKVEIVDADEASLTINTIIEWFEKHVETKLERLERGGARLPRTKKLALAVALFVVTTGIPTADFYFGEDDFTDEDRALMEELLNELKDDSSVQNANRRFYRTIERDSSITGVGVKETPTGAPIVIVPSGRFAEAGGLWTPDEDGLPEKVTRPVMDVVLVKPALVHTPRAWSFKPEGLPEFDAVMRDPLVLKAIQEQGLPERLREGIPMTIRLEVREILVDGQWKLVRGGRSVTRVLHPTLD